MKAFIFLPLVTIIMIACKKNTDQPQATVIEPVMHFDSCSCSDDAKGDEASYISATIDGVPMCFDAPAGLPDSFASMLRYGYIARDTGDEYFDNVYMIRNSSDAKWQIGIFLENTHALKREYPYDLPRVNHYYCEIGELQLISQESFAQCSYCGGTNAYSYFGQFWGDQLKMTVTSFNNNYFEGKFSGTVNSKIAWPIKITNGKFRIKLIPFQVTIDL